MSIILSFDTFFSFISFVLNDGVKTLIRDAFFKIKRSNQYENLINNLFFKIPVSIADSGHKSLISKTNGTL